MQDLNESPRPVLALECPAGDATALEVLRRGGMIVITYDDGEPGPDGYPAFYGVDGIDRHGNYVAGGCSLTSPAEAFGNLQMLKRGPRPD